MLEVWEIANQEEIILPCKISFGKTSLLGIDRSFANQE